MVKTRFTFLILVIVLLAAGFFVYYFNLHNGLFWDDEDWIINNQFVHNLSWNNVKFWFTHNTLAGVGLKSNYYRPFLFFTFALNYLISDIKPLSYHLFSNLLHLANGLLVFWLFWLIFRKKLYAFLAALFFMLHPVQTEAVSYISGRGDLLVSFFMLLSLVLFWQAESRNLSWKNWRKPLSLFLLVLALLSRETAIIFPLLVLAVYVSFLAPGKKFLAFIGTGLKKIWPYFAVVIIYGILRLTILNFLNVLNFYAQPNIYSESLPVRLFTFAHSFWIYLKLLLAPVGLHMERSGWPHLSFFDWPVWFTFICLAGLIGWLVWLYKKEKAIETKNTQKISAFRLWLFGILWFFIALAPVSGLTPINAMIYEHWLYLPLIGFFAVPLFYLAHWLEFLWKKKNKIIFALPVLALGGYLFFYGFQAVQRNILWGKPEEFYQDILKYESDSVRINNNLGNLYFNQRDEKKAEEYYRRAIASEDILPQPHHNIAGILKSRGDLYGAIQEYKKATELDPNFYYAHQDLAIIYAKQGEMVEATEELEILRILLPDNPRVYYNLALVYLARNDRPAALENLQKAIKYTKSDPETQSLIEDLIEKLK